MPAPGKRWRHINISTHASWLHGDQPGFRTRAHRIHSSGDYRNPPSPGEHAGLRRYHTQSSRPEIHLSRAIRPLIGRALLRYFDGCGHQLLAIAVTKVHAHMLVELPDQIHRVRAIVGQAKMTSSRAVKEQLPGSVWASGGSYKPISSRDHHRTAYPYILYDQGMGAWTWSFKDGSDEGQFARKRP